MTDEDTILGLIATAEEYQRAAKIAIEGLAAERAALARAVQGIQKAAGEAVADAARQSLAGASQTAVAAFSKAAEPFTQKVEDVADKADKAAERVNSAARWINIKAAAFALASAVVCILVVCLAVRISVAWEEHRVNVLTEQAGELDAQIENLKAQIAQERATVAELTKRGGRVRWNTCGGRLCFEASSNQGNPGFRSGWTTDKGNVPLVIPRGY